MTHQRFIRRTLLATAISISAANAIQVFGVEQGQYQPGQPGQQIPQGNTSVTQELNRMFQESGQQMPSMNPQELPNGNTPIQGQVRPRQPQNQVTQGKNQSLQNTQQSSSADRPGPIMRFFGKLQGKSQHGATQNNQNYQPPVPPGYRNESPSTAVAGKKSVPAQGQNPKPSQNPSPQHVTRPVTVQSNTPNNTATAAVPQTPGSKPEATQFTNGGMSRPPSQSGATVQSVSPEKRNLPVTSVGESRNNYTQPGSAPGFMSSAGSSTGITKTPPVQSAEIDRFQEEFIRENSVNSGQSHAPRETLNKKITAATAAAQKEVSDFESPFLDTTDPVKSTELLDLDSLIEIPKATQERTKALVQKTISQTPAHAALAAPAPKPAAPVAERNENVSPQAEPTFQNPSFDDAESESLESQAENSVVAPGENPFTGVQLVAPSDVFLNEEELKKGSEGNLFDAPAAPMEDFKSNLPAIDLAPVEDGDSAGLEEVRPTPGDSREKQESAAIVPPPVDGAATAELQPPRVNVPEALSAAETERLRQTAEQERRQRQHRQILSRAGQTGFKGFCPVTLRDRRELTEADPQFSSTFGLQTYTFSSAESKITFDSDPARYAPAAGGSDVVVLVNSGEEQAGQLDYALWYRDRLYLFRSRETMTLFSKDPQRFASQY